MTDEELFGTTPATSPPDNNPADDAVLTVLGEAGSDPKGQLAVASTIANRMKASQVGSASDVVNDPAQGYEAWNVKHRDQLRKRYPVDSAAYQAALAAVGPVLHGEVPPPYAYDSFYSPTAQAQLAKTDGRPVKPAWDDGSGVNLGGNLFFSDKYKGAPQTLSPEDQKAWSDLYGPQVPRRQGTGVGTPQGPSDTPPSSQADTAKFLTLHGMFDKDAPPGSSQNPFAEAAGRPVPQTPGTWYIPEGGGLRQVGSEVADYMPAYRRLAAQRQAAASQPLLQRLATGAGQGFGDVSASLNKITSGLYGAEFPHDQSNPLAPELAADQAQRNSYNLLHQGDDVAALGRAIAPVAVAGPLLGAQGAGLEAVGDAVPALSGVADFLGGEGGNALFTRALSRGAQGAMQGATATPLTVGTSDRPIGQQVGENMLTGALLNPGVRAVADIPGVLGTPKLPQPVSDLAQNAIQKWGIPLRSSQIMGAVDRSAAVRDSELLGAPGSGYAANAAAQHAAFTKGVAATFGSDAERLTPSVMSAAKRDIGQRIGAFGETHNIINPDALQTRLGTIAGDFQQVLPESEAAPLMKQIENIGSVRDGDVIPGTAYQKIIGHGSPLDRAMQSSNSNLRYYAGMIRNALDEAIAEDAAPGEVADFQKARLQYKNLMTVKGLAAQAGITGEISPVKLAGVVNRNFDDRAFSGAGDLGELADIGQTFMKEPPNSGTTARFFERLKQALPFAAGGAGVADLGLATHDPEMALKLAAAASAAAAARLGLNATRGAINNNPLRTNLLLGAIQPPAAVPQVLQQTGRVVGPVLDNALVPGAISAKRNRLLEAMP